MSSRIEQLIDEIEEYIDSCKYQPLSNTKIIVNKEEIDELLRELRMKTPDEIKRYQKIISNKEAILNDARAKAEALIKTLYQYYLGHIDKLPKEYLNLISEGEPRERVVCDYIGAMSDRFAISQYDEIYIPKSWII